MALSIGIVGLPNAGKSTLFNALLKKQAAMAQNYPFTTIEPNTGIVEVPDKRLEVLAKIVKTEKIIPAAVEFVDIAGLVKGAHKGEGLGNKFLANIRETSAICYVLRFFEDGDIIHVHNRVNPLEDLSILEEELILADLETLEKQKVPRPHAPKEEHIAYGVIQKVKAHVNTGKPVRALSLDEDEMKIVQPLFLLTAKPVIYVANMSEGQLANQQETLKDFPHKPVIALCAKLEAELAEASPEEREELLASVGITEPSLDLLARAGYETLNLMSYLTAGEKEVRAWTIKKGTSAPQAAGVIHTDFEKKFIKADIVSYSDFVENNGWLGARQKGVARSEGKEYVMQEGDVVEFKIGA
jgi:GTP-binding protein YchF